MRFKIYLFLILITLSLFAAKKKVPISKLLIADEKNLSTKSQKKKIDFLKGSSGNMPIIDDIEIRIRNDAYQFDRQRYSLRIEPRGIGETKAGRNVYKTRLKYHKQKKKVLTHKLLKNRYQLAIDYLFTQTMLELYKELNTLYEDKVTVLEKSLGKMDFSIIDIIEVENEFTKLKFKNIDREREVNDLRNKIRKTISEKKFIEFDTTSFVNINFINEQIKNTKFVLDTDNVYLKHDSLKLELAEGRYKLESAENRRYISFFEFAYDHGDMMDELDIREENKTKPDYLKEDYNFNNAYIMQIGLRIPFINTDRNDINRRKLSYLSNREEYKKLKNDLERKIKKDVEDIKILISQYKLLEARKNDVNAVSSLKRYMQMEGIDPIKLLSIRESILRNDIQMEKIKFDIIKNYLRIIDNTGQLSKKPLRNYLSFNQDVIAK